MRENGGQVWSATGRAVREAEWAHCCRARSPFGVFPCIRIKRDAFPVQAVAPRNFEEKNKKAVLQAICLQDRFLRFMRQNFGASPPFSYVTPAFQPLFLLHYIAIQAWILGTYPMMKMIRIIRGSTYFKYSRAHLGNFTPVPVSASRMKLSQPQPRLHTQNNR